MSPARLQVSNAPAGIRVRMPVTSRDDVPHRVIYYNIKIDLSTIIFHYVNPALFILTNRLSFVSALADFFPQIRAAGTCFEPVYSGCPVPLYKNTGLPHHTADRYSLFKPSESGRTDHPADRMRFHSSAAVPSYGRQSMVRPSYGFVLSFLDGSDYHNSSVC